MGGGAGEGVVGGGAGEARGAEEGSGEEGPARDTCWHKHGVNCNSQCNGHSKVTENVY